MRAKSDSAVARAGARRTTILAIWLVATVLVAAGLICLAGAYDTRLPQMATETDTWFGADVDRHVFWMTLEFPRRAHLHPLSFLYFRQCARLLRLLGVDLLHHELICAALPVIVPFAIAVTGVAGVLAGAEGAAPGDSGRLIGRSALSLVALLAIGPAIVFGAVGETHALGGAALLSEAALLLSALRLRRGNIAASAWCEYGAVTCGAIAVGLTLTNVVPAAVLLVGNFRRRLIPWVIGALALLALLEFWLLHRYDVTIIVGNSSGIRGGAAYEASYLQIPSAATIRLSVYHVFLAAFGTPNTHFVTVLSESPFSSAPPGALGLYLTPNPTVLQAGAAILWLVGIGIWLVGSGSRREESDRMPPDINLATLCLIALIPMLIFHAAYDIGESYLFSPDIWPLVVLPGLLALLDQRPSKGRKFVASALLLALLLSVAQTAVYTPRLLRSLHPIAGPER